MTPAKLSADDTQWLDHVLHGPPYKWDPRSGLCKDCGVHWDLGSGREKLADQVRAEDDDTPPPVASCGGCRFYKRTGDAFTSKGSVPGGDGECRRYAPRLGAEESTWPGVMGTDLCGEFEWREEPEDEKPEVVDWSFQRRIKPSMLGPALPPRECPCDGNQLKPGQKAHLASCKLQHLGSEEGYSRSLAGLPHECREPGCETLAVKTSMLCGQHGGEPLAQRPVTGKLTV